MSAPLARSAAAQPALSSALASEQTPIGEQMLVHGVTPITPRDRLALRASAPLCPRKPQRPANHGLFDTLSRSQIEMF
jgi:hypothetical protein